MSFSQIWKESFRIFGTQLEYDTSTGEICSMKRVSAGYGKIAVLEELEAKLQITPDHTIYMGRRQFGPVRDAACK
jgi:hypothetical protein